MDLSRRLPHYLWVLACASWAVILASGETGTAEEGSFATGLHDLRAAALTLGIRAKTLDAALTGLQPLPRVIELDRKQPEETLTYAQYLERNLPAARVQKGMRLLNE